MERYWVPSEILFEDDIGKPRDTEVVTYTDHLQALTAVEQERDALKTSSDNLNALLIARNDELKTALGERDALRAERDAAFACNKEIDAENTQLQADLTRLRALVSDVAKSAMAVIEEHRGFVDEDDAVRNTWLDAHHLTVETAEQALSAMRPPATKEGA